MAWRDMIYQYDGSFDGLLCCIYESYVNKERPTAILGPEEEEPGLYELRAVVTDREHAARVYRSFRRISPEVGPFLRRAHLTCLPEREVVICRFVAKLYRLGGRYLSQLADEDYQPLLRAVRHLAFEVEHLRGFVRFSINDGVLTSEIDPKNRVLPLLRAHFCDRCHNEAFFIYDRTHREALLYAGGVSRIVPLDDFEMAPPDTEEAAYRTLWKRFYDTVAIRERENPRLCMSRLPKRFRRTMPEFQSCQTGSCRTGKSESRHSIESKPIPPDHDVPANRSILGSCRTGKSESRHSIESKPVRPDHDGSANRSNPKSCRTGESESRHSVESKPARPDHDGSSN